MLREDFEQLRDFILEQNKYFVNGYALAYKDDVTNAIQVKDGKDVIRLMPADTSANYFYLRSEAQQKYEAKDPERLTDNGTQRLTFLDTQVVHLVAIVNNAEAYQLIENIRNTAMMYQGLNVQPMAASWNREQVLTSELAKMNAEDINASLQRLKDEAIVRIQLNVSKVFIPANCIVNPCNNEYHEQYN